MCLFILFIHIQITFARSNALDDYWKEQDKVAFRSNAEKDGLTIVLTKKSAVKNKTQTFSIKSKPVKKIAIRTDKNKKQKEIGFFIDQKLVRKQIVTAKKIQTFVKSKNNGKTLVLEKNKISKLKMSVKKGVMIEPKQIVAKKVNSENKTRQPTQVEWLIEQEMNDAQNELDPILDQPSRPDGQNQCSPGVDSKVKYQALGKFYQDVLTTELDDRWQETNYGIRFEKKCETEFGSDFAVLVKESMTEGLKCLDQLNGDGSDYNQMMIIGTLQQQQNPLKIRCEKLTRQESLSAEATVFSSDENYPEIKLKNGKQLASRQKVKEVIFHELLHTNGYAHQADIEYMYACQSCCKDANQKKAACQICKSNYESTDDPQYQKDIENWCQESQGQGACVMAFISTLNPQKNNNTDSVKKLIEMMKLNPQFDQLIKVVNKNNPNFGNESSNDQQLARVLIELKNNQLAKARQILAQMNARISNDKNKSMADQFANENHFMLFQQLNSQFVTK